MHFGAGKEAHLGLIALFLFPLFTARADIALPQLNIDPSKITISGLSAGGYMATQLEVAYSSLYRGAAIFAGGVYGCAEWNVISAQVQCMAAPETLDPRHFIDLAKTEEAQGLIDPLSNLKSHRVYIFSGSKDTTVVPRESKILEEFYRGFIPADRIAMKTDIPAEHGQPTLNYGVDCGTGGSPWILNCAFDGAGAALQQLYGNLVHPAEADSSHLYAFSQERFTGPETLMPKTGYIYIPASCANSREPCALNVSLHGCRQDPDMLGDVYRAHAGYNEWAEANRIVMLYPSAEPSWMNPKGCWDWWGYTGVNYLNQDGPQMRAIRDMTAWVAKLN